MLIQISLKLASEGPINNVWRHQAIAWTDDGKGPSRHKASLGHDAVNDRNT